MIVEGRVTVEGAPAGKVSRLVAPADAVVVAGPPPRYVGRGAHKLDAALEEFAVEVSGRRCLDAGSSTGGFTDCLLQRGAAHVVAVDVGTNQLHERLRHDPRVTVRERTDIRSLDLDERADVVVADLSFISTIGLLPTLRDLLAVDGDLVVLLKPQFEAGRAEASRGRGVITDPAVWARVMHEAIDAADDAGLAVVDLAISPITGGRGGGRGNVEFLAHVRHLDSRSSDGSGDILDDVIDAEAPDDGAEDTTEDTA